MNWGYKFSELQTQINTLQDKANRLAEAYAEAEDFTLKFLACCEKHHIDLVSIGQRTDRIKSAKKYPFDVKDSVFADGTDSEDGPYIWSVVSDMGISGGCGNSGQHQIRNSAKLIDGVYELKDGTWRKVE